MGFFPPSYLKRQLHGIIHGFVVHGDKNVSNHHWQKKMREDIQYTPKKRKTGFQRTS